MKVVCIDTNINKFAGNPTLKLEDPLEWGKVYEASFVFFNQDSGNAVEWDKNYLTLEGFNHLDWFPTKNFVTIDVWRQKILNEIL